MQGDDVKVWFPIKKGVLKRTVDHVRAVDGISVTVREGHTVGVVGESGSGKTTLGLALLRLLSSEGAIRFDGKAIQGLGYKDLRPLRRSMRSEERRVGQESVSTFKSRWLPYHIKK